MKALLMVLMATIWGVARGLFGIGRRTANLAATCARLEREIADSVNACCALTLSAKLSFLSASGDGRTHIVRATQPNAASQQ